MEKASREVIRDIFKNFNNQDPEVKKFLTLLECWGRNEGPCNNNDPNLDHSQDLGKRVRTRKDFKIY